MTEFEWVTGKDSAPMAKLLHQDYGNPEVAGFAVSERKLRLFADTARDEFYHGHLRNKGVWSGWESDGCLKSRIRDEGRDAVSVARSWAAEVTMREWKSCILRCIFGNPFRPIIFDPSWLTPTVTAMAQACYADRCPLATMLALADALEEAGCTNADLLNHLRGPGPHARGCWALDLLLGKS